MKLLIFEPAYARIKDRLEALAPDIELLLLHPDSTLTFQGEPVDLDNAEFDVAFASTDVYTTGPARTMFKLLRSAENIKWFQSAAAGFDHPVFAQVATRCDLMTRSDALGYSIAEFIMARVLEVFHPTVERRASQAATRWERHDFRDVFGTTWLIIGMGSIGCETAIRAKAFGAHIIGVRRNPSGDEPADEMITPAELEQAVARADVIVLSAPASEETHHLVDARFLSLMKPDSVLVNIGRGALIDEAALIESLDEALGQGRPGTAILDVFDTEPLPEESPLWDHPRVLITAHCAADSPMTTFRNDDLFLDNLRRYTAGEELRLVVTELMQAAS